MLISKSIETEQGTLQFQGEVSGPELDMILTLGLHALVLRGVISPKELEPSEQDTIQ